MYLGKKICFIVLFVATTLMATAQSNNVVAHWSMDNLASYIGPGDVIEDNSSNGYDGVYQGTVTYPSAESFPGKKGTAMSFNGDDYVNLPQMNIDFSQGFTYLGWVYYDGYSPWSRLLDMGNGTASDNIVVANRYSDNDLYFEIYSGSNESQLIAYDVLETGKWIHIAATVNEYGYAKLYKNGVRVESGLINTPRSVLRTKNYLGKSNWGSDGYFSGKMDEVRIFNRELSEEEIKEYILLSIDPKLVITHVEGQASVIGFPHKKIKYSVFDGTSWSAEIQMLDDFYDNAEISPSVIFFNNRLHTIDPAPPGGRFTDLVYDEIQDIWEEKGDEFTGDQPYHDDEQPIGVAEYKGIMYAVYKRDQSSNLYYKTYDGSTWSDGTQIFDEAGQAVKGDRGARLAVYGEEPNRYLYMVHKEDGNDNLRMTTFNGLGWTEDKRIEDLCSGAIDPDSDHTPALAVYDNKLYMVYKGKHSDNIFYAWYDGTTWRGDKKVEEQTPGIDPNSNKTPNVAVYNDMLYMIYKGAGSNDIYYAWFDRTDWYGNIKIGNGAQTRSTPGVGVILRLEE